MNTVIIAGLALCGLLVIMIIAVVIHAGNVSRAEERAEEERRRALQREVEARRELARKMAMEERVWDPDEHRHSGLLEEDDP